MAKRKKKSHKAKELINNDNVINLDEKREARRAELRAEANASRKKRGAKSISDEVREEISMGDDVPKEPEKKKKKKKKKKPMSPRLKFCFAAIIIVLIIMSFFLGNIINLKIEEHEAKKEVKQLEQQKTDLQQQVSELGSSDYIEQQARDWLKMAQKGEIIYDFSERDADGGNTPAETDEKSAEIDVTKKD